MHNVCYQLITFWIYSLLWLNNEIFFCLLCSCYAFKGILIVYPSGFQVPTGVFNYSSSHCLNYELLAPDSWFISRLRPNFYELKVIVFCSCRFIMKLREILYKFVVAFAAKMHYKDFYCFNRIKFQIMCEMRGEIGHLWCYVTHWK